MKSIKHFYNTTDFSQDEILHLIDIAIKMKQGNYTKTLANKSLAALFFNPSLRTRVSFVMAMEKLGGTTMTVDVKEGAYTFEYLDNIDMNKETIEEKFNNVVKAIYNAYNGEITEEQARQAARNFIAFCQKLIEVQTRLEKEKNN